jgi:hypothetical protein
MRLKALLGLFALVFVTACSSDITSPSTSRAPATHQNETGTNTVGSGG